MSATPNTPANGGQILTDDRIVELAERVDSRVFHADWYKDFARLIEADLRASLAAPAPKLSVWYGAMPESNGKSNFTAILHAGTIEDGITLDRSEYPDRVRYEADRARHLIGELAEEPFILDYDADKRSDYAAPAIPTVDRNAPEKPFAGPGAWFSVDVLGNPMREYAPGKWENCAWPSTAHAGVQPATQSDEPTDREALIASLEDDAVKLSDANPDDEMAQTMREAAAMLESDGVELALLGMGACSQPAAQEEQPLAASAVPYSCETGQIDEALADFLAEHTRLNQDGIDTHAMNMTIALNYAALNPTPESEIAEWREQGYLPAAAPSQEAQPAAQVAVSEEPVTMALNGHQLNAALDLIAPADQQGNRDPDELEGDLIFGVVQHKDDNGVVATGMCCWNDDTDGVLPLDEYPATPATVKTAEKSDTQQEKK